MINETARRYWGFDSLRPLQEEAIRSTLDGRDSLVVMPTGGGKSLCYQLPPLVRNDLTVVVSPLISLMKDQVDALRAIGVAAAQVDSTSSAGDKRAVHDAAMNGDLRLLFVSPERLAMERFVLFLEKVNVARFAIDEAHCISHWGHDFRPEYRQLKALRDRFPHVSLQAFTATATSRVRDDIAAELELRDPAVLVGDFDRPNLVYRVLPRLDLVRQVTDVISRHPKEGGIVYCIRRKDVDELTGKLVSKGINARAYHAGMASDERNAAQEAFSRETCDVIVATVAFGMGIDRSNVRYVIHAALPKSIEHYQQETGRAGRDGLEAECVLFFSGADALLWKSIFQKGAEENESDPDVLAATNRHLDEMDRFARGAICRHRALVEYFGQFLSGNSCNACDLCLGETEIVPDSLVIAQKILSGVARTGQRFGAGYVVEVLRGSDAERIRGNRHDQLSVWGLLKDVPVAVLRDWMWQLIGQGVLAQSDGEYPLLQLNDGSREVMRGEREVRLVQMARAKKKERRRGAGRTEAPLASGDQALFDRLRDLRREIAGELGVPAYVVFGDRTLKELAAVKPRSLDGMLEVHGIGEAKLEKFGERFLAEIVEALS
jgi:ATP-dependent DNA helicase RecQ